MKNQKQTWFVIGLFILASTLSIISYLVMTQFVAFLLQVAGLLQQGSTVTVMDVFGAMWQTFGVKLILPIIAVGAWYVIAELFTTTSMKTVQKHGLYLGGLTIVISAVMLGLTWETFADVPMIAVLLFPAILIAVLASIANEGEAKVEIDCETEECITIEANESEVVTVKTGKLSKRVERRKAKKRQRRHNYHTA
ncbi:MAG: hypothetical protein ACRC3J_10450 [Culicoidibacterales bacterium]